MDNTLRDLQNSSYPTKVEFNNCFIIHSKYFPVLKRVSPFRFLFFRSLKITGLVKFGEQQPVMVNYACGFKQSETGKLNVLNE